MVSISGYKKKLTMKQKPILSIIIPAYNEEKYIRDTLDSIFAQAVSVPYEVIVVDNNSQDKTVEIASQYKVRVIFQSAPGAAATRNAGAKIAQADILYFLDSDCRVPPNQLEKIYQAFQSNNTCEVVAGPYIYDRDGLLPYFFTEKLNYFMFHQRLTKLLFGIAQFSGGNFAIKRELFNRVKGFDENFSNQEIIFPDDLDLAIRLHQMGPRTIVFEKTFKVYSSFRRVKKSPIKHTWARSAAAFAMLMKYKYRKFKQG